MFEYYIYVFEYYIYVVYTSFEAYVFYILCIFYNFLIIVERTNLG